MKTAISLPDSLFERAEQAASRLNLNRSQLYARALEEFLDRTDPERITAAFNAIYAIEASELDPVMAHMQSLSLLEEEDQW